MAENNPPTSPNPQNKPDSTSPTSTQQSQNPSLQQKGKLTVLASTEDGVAQPDSFRGSADVLRDLDVEDLEEQRREEHRRLSERPEERKLP